MIYDKIIVFDVIQIGEMKRKVSILVTLDTKEMSTCKLSRESGINAGTLGKYFSGKKAINIKVFNIIKNICKNI